MLPFPGQQIIALSLLQLPQKIKYWTPLRFWACVSMVCACVFTDNKELILSLFLPLSHFEYIFWKWSMG